MALPSTADIVDRMLETIRNDIIPLTKEGVAKGNKVFGAAVLARKDLSLVIAGVNEESRNPLLHGEVSCLNAYWSMPEEDRPPPGQCLFLSTHEPCSMCLSAITWSGFDNFYYFFSYEDSRDEFNIPHDLKILEEVFGCPAGSYHRDNHFWQSYDLAALIAENDEKRKSAWQVEAEEIRSAYKHLSGEYQRRKQDAGIPLD